jgi:hypothetical protein
MRAGCHDPVGGREYRGIDLPRDDQMHRIQRPQRNIGKSRYEIYDNYSTQFEIGVAKNSSNGIP